MRQSWVEALESRRLLASSISESVASPLTTSGGISVFSSTLPAHFTAADFGSPPIAGATTFSTDVWSASGSGTIGGTSDSFHYVYTTLAPTGSITTRVAAQQNTGAAARAGVMVRLSLDADSRNVMLGLTGAGAAELTSRPTSGASTVVHAASGGMAAPRWLRLARGSSDDFTAYTSADGVNWSVLGSINLGMGGGTVLVGLAVSSANPAAASAVTFDNVSIPTAVTRNGSASTDTFHVRLDPTGVNFQLWQNKNPAVDAPDVTLYRRNLGSLTISGGLGTDTLNVDRAHGNPLFVPATFDGGSGVDTIKLLGSAANDSATITDDSIFVAGFQLAFTDNTSGPASGASAIEVLDANALQLLGDAGHDTLTIGASLSFTPAFHGGAGNNALVIQAGTFLYPTNLADTSDNLTVSVAGASVTFSVNQTLAGLDVGSGGSVALGSSVDLLRTRGLTIAPSGRLDLNESELIVEYNGASAFTTVLDHVLRGYSGSVDPGAVGIVSSASQQSGGTRILALFDNALIGAEDWRGVPIPTNAVVGMLTYFGDVNFDGQVTGDDYTVVDANLSTDPAAGIEWLSGDANLDGIITGDDYTVIDANLGQGAPPPNAPASRANRKSLAEALNL